MMDSVEGKVAVITGGGSGIGRGTAIALARAGAHVAVADIDAERAESVAAVVTACGPEGLALKLDVTEQQDFDDARGAVLDRFGRVDIVMNNVGILAVGRPEEIPMEAWDFVISANLLSAVRSNTAFLPLLLEQ